MEPEKKKLGIRETSTKPLFLGGSSRWLTRGVWYLNYIYILLYVYPVTCTPKKLVWLLRCFFVLKKSEKISSRSWFYILFYLYPDFLEKSSNLTHISNMFQRGWNLKPSTIVFRNHELVFNSHSRRKESTKWETSLAIDRVMGRAPMNDLLNTHWNYNP